MTRIVCVGSIILYLARCLSEWAHINRPLYIHHHDNWTSSFHPWCTVRHVLSLISTLPPFSPFPYFSISVCELHAGEGIDLSRANVSVACRTRWDTLPREASLAHREDNTRHFPPGVGLKNRVYRIMDRARGCCVNWRKIQVLCMCGRSPCKPWGYSSQKPFFISQQILRRIYLKRVCNWRVEANSFISWWSYIPTWNNTIWYFWDAVAYRVLTKGMFDDIKVSACLMSLITKVVETEGIEGNLTLKVSSWKCPRIFS